MKNSKKAKAFILRTTKYSESDLIVQVLTKEGEKISLIARGALKSKKRFQGGVLEPTHYVELTYQDAGSEKLSTLNEAQLIDGFEDLRKSYDKVDLALFVMETLTHVSQEGDDISDGLFNLAGHSLKALEKASELKLFKMHFMLKVLFQQGVLETEPWMEPFLRTNMASHEALEKTKASEEASRNNLYLVWVESRLKEYLSTGNLSTSGL